MREFTLIAAILFLPCSCAMAQGSGSSRVQSQGSGSSRVAPPSSSQSNRRNPSVPSTPRPPTVTQFAASFWDFLHNPKKPYRQWGTPGKAQLQGGPLETGGVAGPSVKFHREVGQTYLNEVANHNLQQLPLGSILVRQEFGPDGQTLESVNVMYRVKTADPKNANWYWLVYRPDGRLATTSPEQGSRPMAGRVQNCIQCHQQAGGKDYIFLNDRPVPGTAPTNPLGTAPGVPPVNPAGSGARR